jgi:hypothetical protein
MNKREIHMRFILHLAVGLALGVGAAPALAQNAPARIRGEIVSVVGADVSVRTRSGQNVQLKLKDGQQIVAVVPASLSDIKPGVFVGAAAMPAADGTMTAMEVHIFPESQRGSGEGFRPFDLAPGSTMTNANISAAVDTVSGSKLTLTYKGGEQTVTVDKATPIVAVTQGAAADLKSGASIVFVGVKAADDSYEATRVIVGRDGTKVPM